MPSSATRSRLPEEPCWNCLLLTPVWREVCIHCDAPQADDPADVGEGNFQGFAGQSGRRRSASRMETFVR